MAPAALAKTELFERFAAGHAAGLTVVTPNRRLAQALKAQFDAFQAARGLAVWEDADILPLGALAQRLHEDSLYADPPAGGDAGQRQLLSPVQERQLWESVLAGAVLLSVADTAADCAAAWRLAHAWRIDGALEKFEGNDDTRAFAAWAKAYRRRCDKEGFTDAARLMDQGPRPKAAQLVAYGFDIFPPQAEDFLGPGLLLCGPEPRNSRSLKVSYPSARHELEAAARWARARLEAGTGGKNVRIGVVVPNLEQRRREVLRIFSRVLHPGHALPGAAAPALPFNLSLGEPLSGYPLVSAALAILEFSFSDVGFDDASRLLRSPFIGGAESEMLARAQLDAQLRRELGTRVSLGKLLSLAMSCPLLRALLERLFSLTPKSKTQSPHDWAQHFTELLKAAGFPGERGLDSAEYQARGKFDEALGEFSRLALLADKFSALEALRRLRRICADTLFQPESVEAPVQVVGVLESAGLEFDCLWVSGLTEEAWPLKARPHPFLPVALQKKAGIPEAAAETSLALDRRITEGWRGAADEVVFSWPAKDQDRDLLPSPLIAEISPGSVELASLPDFQQVLFEAGKTESLPDGKAPPLQDRNVRGGTRVLADQAACPFRAFARHRLAAEGLDAPSEGLDAMDRGILLHSLMANLWRDLKTSAALAGDVKPAIENAARKAVQDLGLEGRFAALEQQRLEKLAADWLEVEKKRTTFEVVKTEEKRALSIGGLEFSGRIDRMDWLIDGSYAIIDYKTGSRATSKDWLGARPDEPQLPLYAITAPENVSAVAFAKLKRGDLKMAGLSLAPNAIPGVKPALNWPGLVATWKKDLEALAGNFAEGEAQVDPKKGFATCRNCDLQPLCRVHERLSPLAEEGEEFE